jgi:diaminopimelate decarboxylase
MTRRSAGAERVYVESERPPGFVLRQQRKGLFRRSVDVVLQCDDIPLAKLAERYGTPLYVYSATAIRERFASFDGAFRNVPHTVCYSVKANSNLSILRLLGREGCGFDVVSGGELERVLIADRSAARKIVFSGVGKTRDEIKAALEAGILLFNVESESELWVLAECATQLRKAARLALRVNPDVAADTHPYISTGLRKHKFGVPIGMARELYAKASGARYLKVAGVSVHIGSQITEFAPFAEAVTRVADLVRLLRSDGHTVKYVDTGGGLGIAYRDPESEFTASVTSYARAVTVPLKWLNVHLLLEPGRAIIAPAGVLVTRVVYRKENGGKRFLVVDAAMNDLIRPALYGAYHEIVPVVRSGKSSLQTREMVDVVGPVCESSDFFARDRKLPRLEEGDLLAILDTGAYGMALASNYNTRPRPAEILVHGKSAKVIRRREKVRELYSSEL